MKIKLTHTHTQVVYLQKKDYLHFKLKYKQGAENFIYCI